MVDPRDSKGYGTPSVHDLTSEAFSLLLAGTESTATTLVQGTFQVLNDKVILEKLQEELSTAIPDKKMLPQLEQLQRLPYLVSIYVNYRLAFGLQATRLASSKSRYGSPMEHRDDFQGLLLLVAQSFVEDTYHLTSELEKKEICFKN